MKEATGELNMTIIIVIAVSLLIAFLYYTLWPVLHSNFEANSGCSRAICENPCGTSGNQTCSEALETLVKCHLPNSTEEIRCPWKG